MLRLGLSAGKIAHALGTGLTRNSIIGRVYRDSYLKPIGLKGGNSRTPAKQTAKPKPRPAFEALNIAIRMEGRALAPKPAPVVIVAAPLECRSIPLLELKYGDCRWVCNEAGPGELHLFCANPADGSYCPGHKARSTGQGTESERRAVEALGRAA